MVPKRQRQQQILELIVRNRVESQDQLLDLLEAESVPTTQSTLSRDLRELGVVKGRDGYRRPEIDPVNPTAVQALAQSIRRRLTSIDVGGNIVVLRTELAEEAADVASLIDAARLHQAVSAVAIGETVLVVARSAAYARDLARAFRAAPIR